MLVLDILLQSPFVECRCRHPYWKHKIVVFEVMTSCSFMDGCLHTLKMDITGSSITLITAYEIKCVIIQKTTILIFVTMKTSDLYQKHSYKGLQIWIHAHANARFFQNFTCYICMFHTHSMKFLAEQINICSQYQNKKG